MGCIASPLAFTVHLIEAFFIIIFYYVIHLSAQELSLEDMSTVNVKSIFKIIDSIGDLPIMCVMFSL